MEGLPLHFSDVEIRSFEYTSLVTGVGYSVLAAMRNRQCWIAGAVSSVCAAIAYGANGLPMQSGLQVFFVGMALYGWISWTRSAAEGELPVSLWPFRNHLIAAVLITALSLGIASLLAANTDAAAWPRLDSLTTWFSLLATWLVARGKLENWLYWIVVDGLALYLYWQRELYLFVGLFALYLVLVVIGLIRWHRDWRAQSMVPA